MTIRSLRFLPAVVLAVSCVCVGRASADDEKELTPNAHYMSGKLYMSQKVYDKAEREFRAAVEGDSTHAEYHAMWANSLSELAKMKLASTASVSDRDAKLEAVRAVGPLYQNAQVEFAKAIAMDPKGADEFEKNRLHYWVELYQLADARFKAPDYEDALELYKLTTILDPKEPTGVFWVGFTLAKLEKTMEGVQTALQARAMAEERIAELGDCSQFKSQKKKGECAKRIQNMKTIQNNVDNFTKSKNYELGKDQMNRAVTEQDVAKKRERFLAAIDYFEKALTQDPTLLGVRFDKADAQFKLGQTFEESDTTTAHKHYRSAATTFLEIAADDSTEADARKDARYNAIMALYQSSDWAGLLPLLKVYIDVDPHDADIWRRIAKTMAELDRNSEAFSSLMTANALGEQGEPVDKNQSMNTVKNLYGQSAAAKALQELGEPEEVRSFQETSENGREITTWIWWTKGQIRHYVDGTQVGTVSFAPEVPDQSSK
jgi:tetratricopeptide (TPR) repeat protein